MPAITSKTLFLTAGALGGVYFVGSRMKDFRTPGIRNIEERHTVAGAAPSHTPAQRSRMGDKDQSEGMQEVQKGLGSKHFKDNVSNQKPEPSGAGKKWNETHMGNEAGTRT